MAGVRTGSLGHSAHLGHLGHPGRLAELPSAGAVGQQVRRLAGSGAVLLVSGRLVPLWAVVSAALSPFLIVAGWLISDALQPASYSPLRQTVSVMSGYGGTDRWVMTAALFAVGGCHLVTAAGLGALRPPARVLLLVAGLSSIGIALCPEPVHGSTPAHLAWTALGAVTIAIWPAFAGGRGPRPLLLTVRWSAVMTAVFVALLAWLVLETQGGSLLGLAERLSSAIDISWPFIVAVALRRSALRAAAGAVPRLVPTVGVDSVRQPEGDGT
jgi:Protein of unknown function (DUF998)